MLLVHTYIAPSPIHGLGLFAKDDIPAKTLVWRYDSYIDRAIPSWQYGALPPLTREFVDCYGYVRRDKSRVLCGDHARFINHSDQPNLSSEANEDNYVVCFVPAGTELTVDYRKFDEEWKNAAQG